MTHRKEKYWTRNNKGIVIPLFTVFLTAVIGLGAMVIDVSQEYATKTRIQNAIDQAVVAGASQISSNSSVANIKNTALNYLNNNLTMTLPSFSNLALNDSNLSIQVGVYNSSNMTFTENESLDTANAIKVAYTYTAMTYLAPIFMIDSIQISDDAIAMKKPAGYLPPGSGFPLAIDVAALDDALTNNNMLNLNQSGMNENSYWTKFTSDNPSANDIEDIIKYFQYGTGTKPGSASVNDVIRTNNGNMTANYFDMEPTILEGMTFVFSVVSPLMGGDATLKAFVGATINMVVNSMGDQHLEITIIPQYIENGYGGLGLGPSPSGLDDDEEDLLATGFGIVQ